MKKIILMGLTMLLLGCSSQVKQPAKKVEKPKQVVYEVEEIDYVEDDALKHLVLLANEKTNIVDIEELHALLSQPLLDAVDMNQTIESQKNLINDVIKDELVEWKFTKVKEMLKEQQVILNDDDLETLVARTSTYDAQIVMKAYEIAYLKREKK